MNSHRFISILLCVLGAGPCLAPAQSMPPTPPSVSAEALQKSASTDSERMLADLARDLTGRFQLDGQLHLEMVRPWTAPENFQSPFRISVLEAPSGLASSVILRVRVQDAKDAQVDTTFVLRAQLLREVWVTRGAIQHGAAFDPAELDTRTIDVLRERDTVAVADATTDLTFSHGVNGGRIVTWRDVAKRALVRKGEVIQVSAVDGALSISMKALAMENGGAGESIRVRNIESKKEFTAEVVGNARAQVRL